MSEAMRREIDGLKSRAGRYEADVRAFFETVRELKSDMLGMRSDMQSVRSDMQSMKSDAQDMRETLHRVEVVAVRTSGDLSQLKTYVHDHVVTKSGFHARMDGFSGLIQDFRLHLAHQKERLDDLQPKPKDS